MGELIDQVKNIELEILNSKADIKNQNEILKKLIALQKIQYLKDQEISAIETAKLHIIKSIAKLLENDKNSRLHAESSHVSIFKKILLIGSLAFTSLVSGIIGFITFRNLFGFFLAVSNPWVLAACVIVGIVEAFIFLVSDAKEICCTYNVSFLNATSRLGIYKDQLSSIKEIHRLIGTNDLVNLNIKPFKTTMDLIHDDLKEKKKCLDVNVKPTLVRRGLQLVSQVISGTVATASGFFLAQCAIGLCATALLTTPVGWVLCGIAAVLSLSAFCFFRKRAIAKAVDTIMGQPSKFKVDLDSFVTEDINKINSRISLNTSMQQSRRLNKRLLQHQPDLVNNKQTHLKRFFNTNNLHNRFFQQNKQQRSVRKINSKKVIHRSRLA